MLDILREGRINEDTEMRFELVRVEVEESST